MQYKNYPRFPIADEINLDDDNNDDDAAADNDDALDLMSSNLSKDLFCKEQIMYEYLYYLVKIHTPKIQTNEDLIVGDVFQGQQKDCLKEHWWEKITENLTRNIARRFIDTISAGTQESLLRRSFW